jgi:(E)-4-hydroxy-3-methylbut-2-enyl-diphosphate synthase
MTHYCDSIFQTHRWQTRVVMVGGVAIGGNHPIRIQSMTTTNSRDVPATIDQIMLLADSGCELVRLTVQGMKEAEACEAIKNGLIQRGYAIPLVADIHFFPPAALHVIDFVDKVRINPGNYVDKRASFKTIVYDDDSYSRELAKIEEKFTPLVVKCKRLNKALRIGTNHGSLSDRIMNRYGDTPKGMVESALEFARICRQHDFHNLIFSMKASNPQVMIQAYRLLAAEMRLLGWNYPLHLGVTEAGEGEDGRIKSAMGIGALLLDGLGDTIRVSLTEDPWHEIDPCRRLIALASSCGGKGVAPFEETNRDITSIVRRPVAMPRAISLHRDGSVIVAATREEVLNPSFCENAGCDMRNDMVKLSRTSADGIMLTDVTSEQLTLLQPLREMGISLYTRGEGDGSCLSIMALKDAPKGRFSAAMATKGNSIISITDESPELWPLLEGLSPALIFLAPTASRLHYCRHFFDWLKDKQIAVPVILNFSYDCSKEDLVVRAAAECGSLLCDGLGDGLCIEAPHEMHFLRQLSFNILQAARMRSSKTDFISCPSCGRTLFNLQEVSSRIRSRTAHLPGVKIAIMGCIVNGPGEMADAHFGYVGSKPGMIDLYVGKECVEKNIPFDEADERLVSLIKQHNRWIEPEY